MNTTSLPTPPRPPHRPPPPPGASDPTHGPRPVGWTTPSRQSRLPSAAEALGWGGGIVTTIGVAATTADFWADLRGWPLLLVLLAATAVLGAGALTVAGVDRDGTDSLARQLSVALYVMTGICTTWTTYVAADLASGGRTYLAVLAAASASAAISLVAARRTDADQWRATALMATTVASFAAAALSTDDTVIRSATVALTGAAALTGVLAWRPDATRLTQWLALTTAVGGAQAALVLGPLPWAAGLIALGMAAVAAVTLMRGATTLGLTAALAAAAIVLQVLGELVPGVFTLSTAMLAVGVAMVIGCIVVIRRARDA